MESVSDGHRLQILLPDLLHADILDRDVMQDGEMVLFGDRESVLKQQGKDTLKKILINRVT